MSLLQSGANANIIFDLANTPIAHLVVMAILIVIIIYVLVKYYGNIGPLKRRDQANSDALYHMNCENSELDEQLRVQARLKVSVLDQRLNNIFYDYKVCPVARIALAGAVRGVLQANACDNHFTTVLMPDNRDDYLEGLLKSIEDQYVAIYSAIAGIKCEKDEILPTWEEIKDTIKEFIIEWANLVIADVIKTCIKKIAVYKKYEPKFVGDSYRTGIVVGRIAKNKDHITLLDRRRSSTRPQDLATERRGKTEWN